jgi:DNA-binding MarR family transcriptional regulator
MEIPTRDTPSLQLIERGFGGEGVDRQAVADCMQLLRVSKRLLGFFYGRFVAAGISPGKYSVLCELLTLADGESLSPSALAGRIGVSRPTVTGLIDGLSRQGYVVRQPDPEDRRRIGIRLTGEGSAFVRALLPDQFRTMAQVIGVLDPLDRDRLRGMLATLEENLTWDETGC